GYALCRNGFRSGAEMRGITAVRRGRIACFVFFFFQAEDGIRDEVEAAFPGIELKSEIQGYAFLERFADGVERYKALSSPSPDDDRWAGVCFYQLLRDDEALIALERAAARGQPAARINKAHLLP